MPLEKVDFNSLPSLHTMIPTEKDALAKLGQLSLDDLPKYVPPKGSADWSYR